MYARVVTVQVQPGKMDEFWRRIREAVPAVQAIRGFHEHLGLAALRGVGTLALRLLLQGQTNFLRMLWKFRQVYNPERQYADHLRKATYTLNPPQEHGIARPRSSALYVHMPRGGQRRPSGTTEQQRQ